MPLQIVDAYLLTVMCSWYSLKLSLHVDQSLVKFAQQSLQTIDERLIACFFFVEAFARRNVWA